MAAHIYNKLRVATTLHLASKNLEPTMWSGAQAHRETDRVSRSLKRIRQNASSGEKPRIRVYGASKIQLLTGSDRRRRSSRPSQFTAVCKTRPSRTWEAPASPTRWSLQPSGGFSQSNDSILRQAAHRRGGRPDHRLVARNQLRDVFQVDNVAPAPRERHLAVR
jgi:hypothetical protein